MIDSVSISNNSADAADPGLCCQNMAKNSIALFMQQIGQAEGDLKVKVAKIVFDLFIIHDPFTLLTGVMPVSRSQTSIRYSVDA